MKYPSNLRVLGLGLVLAGAASLPLHADDTEIFVGRSDNYSDPNVLFVIDTSGSMNTIANFLAYDPATTYAGSCNSGRLYWSTDGSEPDCTTTSNYVNTNTLVCNAAVTPLATDGSFRDRFATWHDVSGTTNDIWNNLSSSVHTEKVECRTDNGVHGDGISTDRKSVV